MNTKEILPANILVSTLDLTILPGNGYHLFSRTSNITLYDMILRNLRMDHPNQHKRWQTSGRLRHWVEDQYDRWASIGMLFLGVKRQGNLPFCSSALHRIRYSLAEEC